MPVSSLALKARQIGGITHIRLCFDQPNRRIRTRMYGGVGGTPCEGRSYPDGHSFIIFQDHYNLKDTFAYARRHPELM